MIRKAFIELINGFSDFEVIMDAGNGEELIRKMQTADQLPDICLLDINMPKMDGYETASTIRQKWEDMRILALSGHDSEHCIIKMLRNGANGYISKGMTPAALEQALFGVYHKFFYHSDLVTGRMIHALHNTKRNELNITEKEMEFLRYCISDLTYKEIAAKMNVSVRTAEGYRDSLFLKLDLKTRAGLVVFAMNIGLQPFE